MSQLKFIFGVTEDKILPSILKLEIFFSLIISKLRFSKTLCKLKKLSKLKILTLEFSVEILSLTTIAPLIKK